MFLSDKHKGLNLMVKSLNFNFEHGVLTVSDKIVEMLKDDYEILDLIAEEFNARDWYFTFASSNDDITDIQTGYCLYHAVNGISKQFYVFDCDKDGHFTNTLIANKSVKMREIHNPENFNNAPPLDAIKTANWFFSPTTCELGVSDSFRESYDPDFPDDFMDSFNSEMSDFAWSFPDVFDFWFVGSLIHGQDETPALFYAWDNNDGHESLEERLATYGKANLFLMTVEDESEND